MKDTRHSKIHITHAHIVAFYLVIYDLIAVSAAFFLALLLRFDLNYSMIPQHYLVPWLKFAPFYAVFCIVVFYFLRLYKSIWRFASIKELERVTLVTIITCGVHIILITLILCRMPMSYYIIGTFLQFTFVVGIRFSYRFVLLLRGRKTGKNLSHVMLIGAGSAGQLILRDLKRSGEVQEKVVCMAH